MYDLLRQWVSIGHEVESGIDWHDLHRFMYSMRDTSQFLENNWQYLMSGTMNANELIQRLLERHLTVYYVSRNTEGQPLGVIGYKKITPEDRIYRILNNSELMTEMEVTQTTFMEKCKDLLRSITEESVMELVNFYVFPRYTSWNRTAVSPRVGKPLFYQALRSIRELGMRRILFETSERNDARRRREIANGESIGYQSIVEMYEELFQCTQIGSYSITLPYNMGDDLTGFYPPQRRYSILERVI